MSKKKKFKKKHGFPPEDIWSLDYWLAREMGKRLRVWGETGPLSYPPSMTYEEWREEILTAASNFEKYCQRWESDKFEEYNDAGVDAIKWVADNFNGLWD